METLKVKCTGIRPLVMSNPQTVQLSNPYSVESRRVTKLVREARKKQAEDRLAELEKLQARNDWESSGYYDPEKSLFFLPDTVVMACIRAGATADKRGRDIDRCVIMSETQAFITGVPKHKNLDEYWEDKSFRLECPAKVPPKTGSLIWKVRCMIPSGWQIAFTLEYDPEIIPKKTLSEAITKAGLMSGIGGWRPKFGRFIAEVN